MGLARRELPMRHPTRRQLRHVRGPLILAWPHQQTLESKIRTAASTRPSLSLVSCPINSCATFRACKNRHSAAIAGTWTSIGKRAKLAPGKTRTTARCARVRRSRGPACGDATRERDVSASVQSRSCAHLRGRIPKGVPAPRFGAHTWRGFVTQHGVDSRRVFGHELAGQDAKCAP